MHQCCWWNFMDAHGRFREKHTDRNKLTLYLIFLTKGTNNRNTSSTVIQFLLSRKTKTCYLSFLIIFVVCPTSHITHYIFPKNALAERCFY